MEDQNITAVLGINLSAAFDTMDHDIFLQVLKNQHSMDGKVLEWYGSYLHPRSCIVDVKGSKSTSPPLEFSVSQESCGGLVLYFVYASTLRLVVSPPLDLNGFANKHSVNISFRAEDQD